MGRDRCVVVKLSIGDLGTRWSPPGPVVGGVSSE